MKECTPNCLKRLQAAQIILRDRRPVNEIFCFAEALEECAIALEELGAARPHDDACDRALQVIRDAINDQRIVAPDPRGWAYARAQELSASERAAFEAAVDRLVRFLGGAAGRRFLRAIVQERYERGTA